MRCLVQLPLYLVQRGRNAKKLKGNLSKELLVFGKILAALAQMLCLVQFHFYLQGEYGKGYHLNNFFFARFPYLKKTKNIQTFLPSQNLL